MVISTGIPHGNCVISHISLLETINTTEKVSFSTLSGKKWDFLHFFQGKRGAGRVDRRDDRRVDRRVDRRGV